MTVIRFPTAHKYQGDGFDDMNDIPPPTDADAPADHDAAEPNNVMQLEPGNKRISNGHAAPTVEDPLRGLQHLAPIALVGRSRIREFASQPIAYLWRDIAVAGTIVLIAGAPGEGKTTLLFLVLAARLSAGDPIELLGRQIEPAPAGKWIVLIEGEHSESSTARKLLRALTVLGLDDAGLDRIIILARKAVRLGSPEWADVCTMSKHGFLSDIAIDTVARVAPADANDEREQVAIFAAVAAAIEVAPEGQPKPTVWAVAHTRKNGTTGDLSDVSGSAQRTGQADTVLLLKASKADGRTVSTTVTFAKLREDPDEYPLPCTFAIEGDRLRFEGAIRDARPLPDRIVSLLRAEPHTKTALASKLGRNGPDIEQAISQLFAERTITTTTITVRGKDCRAFTLAGKQTEISPYVSTYAGSDE